MLSSLLHSPLSFFILRAGSDYRYLILVIIAILEGPLISMISGILLRLGVFSFWPALACLMIGDIASDTYWYFIGYHGGRRFLKRFGKYFSVTDESFDRLERLYQRHYAMILFLSKITMGLGFAVPIVAAAGATHVPFKRYMFVNILSQPIWTGILLSVGYFLGEFYVRANRDIEIVSVTAAVIILIALLVGFGRYLRTRIAQTYLQ